MGVPDRGAIRSQWASLCTTEGEWAAVYDHQPNSFGGQSPVATVHSGPVRQVQDAFDDSQDVQVEIWHTNYVKRTDPDTAEDTLDDLLVVVGDMAIENRTDSNWDELRIEGPTQPEYLVIDGQQYRAEQIRLVMTVYV